MSSENLRRVPAFGGTIALCLVVWAAAAASQPLSLTVLQASYRPIQAINYEIGSKAVSGYFVTQGSDCFVTLMVIEKSDPEAPLAQSAARLRVLLQPGEVAGLDSEEGRSLNVTCAEDAQTLLVDVGERQQLLARQMAAQQFLAAAAAAKSQ